MSVAMWSGWAAVIVTIVGALVAWRKLRPEIEKLEANAAKIISDASAASVTMQQKQLEWTNVQMVQLQKQVDDMNEQLDMARRKVRNLQSKVEILTNQVTVATRTLRVHGLPIPWEK